MSGGESSGSGASTLGSLSVLPLLIGNLFGLNTKVKRGGLSFARPGSEGGGFDGPDVNGAGGQNFANQVFTPDDFDALGTLTDVRNPINFDLGQIQGIGNSALDFTQQLTEDGGLDILNQTRKLLLEEDTAAANESLGGFGLNANDFSTQLARARLSEQSAAQTAQQALQNRTAAAGNFSGFSNDLLAFEQTGRQAERSRTEGGQLLDLIFGLEAGTQGQTGSRNSNFSAQGGYK